MLFNFSLTGVRNISSRRSVATLLVGILVGFSVATVFISAEPKSLWFFNFSSNSHHVYLRDPHTNGDLADGEWLAVALCLYK